MGLIKSSDTQNLEKTSKIVATQISSFTPTIAKLPVNEGNEGTLDIEGNDQAQLDTEITHSMDSEEIKNPVDL